MRAKFKTGDKVRCNHHVPLWVWGEFKRHRTRTVKSIGYDESQQHILYELGEQGNGGFPYLFRAWQLNKVTNRQAHRLGRPRQKRKYNHKLKVLSNPSNQQLTLPLSN